MSLPRLLALLVGIILVLIPAFFVLRLFGEGAPLGAVAALTIFYAWLLAGVANQRRRGRVGGYYAFRGSMDAVMIAGVIGIFGPFVYGALTHTTTGNMAPLGGVLIMIFGGIAAVGIGLIVYDR